MASAGQLDPRALIFPITKPPPRSWTDVSLVHGRLSRHWALIRGLIDEQKKARKNWGSSNSRLSATLFREVVTRLSLSLEAVDTKDKFNSTPGVGDMIHKVGEKYLRAQVTARNQQHVPPAKPFLGSAAAILVAMSREAKRRGLEGGETGSVWLNEQEIRALAAPLCEEDLTHRGDDIVLGEVENYGWCSMVHLCNDGKFDCVRRKDLDEKITIAKLEELGRRPVCSHPGCDAFATKCLKDLSDRVKVFKFLASVYCKEHHKEMDGGDRGGGKRKRSGAKGKGKAKSLDNDDLDDALDTKTGIGSHPSPPSRASVTGKIKAEWYRRVLGEALLRQELDRLERWKGFDVAKKVADTWEKDFIRNAKNVYALTVNGQWIAANLEKGLASGSSGPTTASPILNRSSYASCSERDGGGGGGTAVAPHNGHSPLAPARANGGGKPGVRLLIDSREKRGVSRKSQLSELTSFLNSRGVSYEVREWKCGDYGWVVQPNAGRPAKAGDMGFEEEYVVPRLLERKRVDDLAESMKDGRLVRQKKAMLRARACRVMSDIEIHVEGDVRASRFKDEIHRRGLTSSDLEAALQRSAFDGFKIFRHANFAVFSAYLADATVALQKEFEAKSMDFESFITWQNFLRFCKGQEPLKTQATTAKSKARASAELAQGYIRRRPPTTATGRPPLRPGSGYAGPAMRQRTLDEAIGVTDRDASSQGHSNTGDVDGSRPFRGVVEDGGTETEGTSSARRAATDDERNCMSDSSDDCSVVEVRKGGPDPLGAGQAGVPMTSSTRGTDNFDSGDVSDPFVAAAEMKMLTRSGNHSPEPTTGRATAPSSSVRNLSSISKRARPPADEFEEEKQREADSDSDECGSVRHQFRTKRARSLSFVDGDDDVADGDDVGEKRRGTTAAAAAAASSSSSVSIATDLSSSPSVPHQPTSGLGNGNLPTTVRTREEGSQQARERWPVTKAHSENSVSPGNPAPASCEAAVYDGDDFSDRCGGSRMASGIITKTGAGAGCGTNYVASRDEHVVDLSLESPSPPSPRPSRLGGSDTSQVQPPQWLEQSGIVKGVEVDGGGRGGCCSDDEFDL